MARRVKCVVTGEYGTSDSFVKMNGHYYKSIEIYQADQERKKNRHDLIDYVCREFLGYSEGQPFSTFLPRKLQELSFYDDALILQVFREQASVIHQCLDRMTFSNELNKISYIVGIVRNALPEALQKQERECRQEQLAASRCQRNDVPITEVQPLVVRQQTDISHWLEEDEL